MHIHHKRSLLSLAAAALLCAGPAMADEIKAGHSKNAMTEAQVRALLTEQGYTRIDDLDFEDGMWETDATSADGNRVDVYIHPVSGKIRAEALVSKFSEEDIKARLTTAGYSKVHDVDFDDGIWKAEAERADGNDVEVRIDAETGEIISVEND